MSDINEMNAGMRWYVAHTYSGYENKVKANLEKIVENRGMQDMITDVRIPVEIVSEGEGESAIQSESKILPAYVLIRMIMCDESWHIVRGIRGVTGFVGPGSKPVPLTDEEVRRMGIEKVYIDLDIEQGDNVKVISGPFESFMGVVEEVNMDRQVLRVKISMFGRDTPVELEFGQVDKI